MAIEVTLKENARTDYVPAVWECNGNLFNCERDITADEYCGGIYADSEENAIKYYIEN